MNWYEKIRDLEISSKEKWIFNLCEQMLKSSDERNLRKLFSLTKILKNYLISNEEISRNYGVRDFINFSKKALLSKTDDAHKEISQISAVLLKYQVMISDLRS
jgi:hypothetical protein